MFKGLRESFADFKIAVDQLVADDDKVAIAYTLTGTHQGSFLGVPATGKWIKARGGQIGRFSNGKLVERWGSSDQLGNLNQIGGGSQSQAA